ncbi:MAG: hypothetical protein QOH68_2326, partial [Nocardioidaceae bacterium]|nr:hypothetical protein [Nocardioidaceae bacterium]
MSTEEPISYTVLAVHTPMLTSSGKQFGTVEHVLQVPDLDLFDGIVVSTPDGVRFVDRDQVDRITKEAVHCALTDAQAAELAAPDGAPIYEADPDETRGDSLSARFGRLFGR